MKRVAVILAVLVAALAAATAYVYLRPARKLPHPHIVLVLIDTLRADHVGCYGYPRPTTPYIDSLAARGALFENFRAPASWTLPSVATLFTGLPPQKHGVVEGLQSLGILVYQHQLPDEYVTLPERLAEAGYETYGYSANIHITKATGFGQGFKVFREAPTSNAEQVEEMIDEDMGSLRQTDQEGRPYFVYMHFFDPHTPYLAREPYLKIVAPNLDQAALLAANPMKGDLENGFEPGHFRAHPEELQALKDVYDSEIAATDAAVGRIMGRLPGADRAVVIVMSDHGEAFDEHGTMLHGYDLFEEVLRVPLIVREPLRSKGGDAARRVTDPVAMIDLMPTILRFAGVGKGDLTGLDLKEKPPWERPFLYQLSRGPVRMHGAMIWPLKEVLDETTGRTRLFDLQKDPEEKKDIFAEGAVPEALAQAVAQAGTIEPLVPQVLVKHQLASDKESLKSLGYLTGGPSGKPAPSEAAETTPPPALWYVDMGVCPRLEQINKQCAPPDGGDNDCTKGRIADIVAEICPTADSYTYKKKCEFMRFPQTLKRCREAAAPESGKKEAAH